MVGLLVVLDVVVVMMVMVVMLMLMLVDADTDDYVGGGGGGEYDRMFVGGLRSISLGMDEDTLQKLRC